ncbi:MAG: transcription antitermination factor NusB [Oscillospiraceae bacterium]|nr:transcription antitermination factor NusB [Oscillospiraceae bacterium]
MKRRAQREQAFLLVFEKSFDDCDSKPKPRMSYFGNGETHEFTERVFTGVKEHEEEINKTINESIVGWDKDRLSRIVICILRIAVYEMFFEESVPISVSINEAVEIAKKYGTDKSSSFVNGVLGIIAVRLESGNHKKLNKRKLG